MAGGLTKKFYAFVATQLLGAFNDNLFKQLILFLAASVLFPDRDLQGLAFAVFSLPFILFSGVAGDLSERFSKSRIMVRMKQAEIGIMALGGVALQLKSWPLMLVTLFIMGAQSAIFGPAKYGGIPELVPRGQLLQANGVVTMTTFVAVLLGGALAGPLLDTLGSSLWLCGLVCTGFAALGTFTARQIPFLEATQPELRVRPDPAWSLAKWLDMLFGGLVRTVRALNSKGGLMAVVFLNSAYWFNAGAIQQAIVGLGAPGYLDIGDGEKKQLSFVLATLSVGVGMGALIAPKLAKRLGPGRLTVVAAGSMFIGQLALNGVGTVVQRGSGALLLTHAAALWIGVSGAAVIVPMTTTLQSAPDEGTRGQTFGVTNFFNFVCLFLAGIYYLVLRSPALDVSPALTQSLAGAVMLLVLWRSRGVLATLKA